MNAAGYFEKERSQPNAKQEKKAKQWMLRESEVMDILQQEIADFEQEFNAAATMDINSGGLLNLSGSTNRWGGDVEAAKKASNWVPDWKETESF